MKTILNSRQSVRINNGSIRSRLNTFDRSKINGRPSPTPNSLIFRILEDDDFRITEDGDFRILE